MYMYVNIYTYIYIHIHIHICIYNASCICTYMYIYICTYICVRICIYINIFTYIYVRICTCVHVHKFWIARTGEFVGEASLISCLRKNEWCQKTKYVMSNESWKTQKCVMSLAQVYKYIHICLCPYMYTCTCTQILNSVRRRVCARDMTDSYVRTRIGHVKQQNMSCQMSDGKHKNESCLSRRRVSSCHTQFLCHMHMNESCHSYERVMSHVWMSHVTLKNESCLSRRRVWARDMTDVWRENECCHVTHIKMSHVCLAGEFCRAEWVMSHIKISHVIHMIESCHT